MLRRLLLLFRRIALRRFVKAHPPSRHVSPAPEDLVAAYEGRLPAGLLELWREKGLGFYGDRQLALIDPRRWQAALDRWIVSPPDAVQRIPIALTPFGILLYYRKLTATDEDVVCFDPVSKNMDVLTWSLEEFFNRFLCDQTSLDTLIPPRMAQVAREECGPLAPGEVYEVDQRLLTMQMLKIAKVDALEMHRRLRDAVDPPEPKADKPQTVADALPATHRAMFADIGPGDSPCGIYLSSYIDWHRLLALQPDGRYHLLFWRIHHQTFERIEVRSYTGSYGVSRNAEGDEVVKLGIALRKESLGSDANDSKLVVMRTGDATWLLRSRELEDIATAIGGRDVMGRSEYYFRCVTLDDAFTAEPSDGRQAPPFEDLPGALKVLIHIEPLITTITHVDDPNPADEEDGRGTVMCTLDLGEDDGLRHNMPLYSPRDTGRDLIGWVWEMAPKACKVGVRYRRGENGAISHGPEVGDVLTTRAPGKR
ncbi:hypothetical protein KXS07_06600 [Inquilinus limosus]|uniref:GAD-like domain-containing protein n=1 Tax=Inquilinus limosus TaxID=171674 RepID=UPI003F14400E